jgi:signal transduction histidine kinase
MSRISGLLRVLAFTLIWADAKAASRPGWDHWLVEKYSNRWQEIQSEIDGLTPRLEKLPAIPIDDQGGTGGYAAHFQSATPVRGTRFAVEIRWAGLAPVDLIALIPARRYDADGLDSQYGLPQAFTVELIDEKGAVVQQVIQETDTRLPNIRRGHPFVYPVSPPIAAAGVRITADRLGPEDKSEQAFVHAWAEVFAFHSEKNIALGAKVTSTAGSAPPAPWHWNSAFLVDGETPLGLPEIPAEPHANIGWMSEARELASQSSKLSIDLGQPALVDSIRLVPAKKPTSDLPSGFGFPRKFTLSSSPTGEPASWSILATVERSNPGHNPVMIDFPAVQTRHLQVEATQLWKDYAQYPAFFALSELEIFSKGQNIALGKSVNPHEGMGTLTASSGRFWSSAALSDGFGPAGKLVPTRDWILQLDQRLKLESRRQNLLAEAGLLIEKWRRTVQMIAALLALVGVFLIVALPIRYRLQAQRELVQVRERIAGDLHDEVGSNLGSIQMLADLAEGRSGGSDELKRIQRIAAETVSSVRDIVWLLQPTGDHRIGTVEHLRETSSIMLESLQWKFTANEAAWQTELPEESNRHLFLFFREALHNIMRHAKATTVQIHAETTAENFSLRIADNGIGIDPEKLARPATLRALRQRSVALSADFQINSRPSHGTELELTIPHKAKK